MTGIGLLGVVGECLFGYGDALQHSGTYSIGGDSGDREAHPVSELGAK